MREAERAAIELSRNWGSEGFERGADLVGIYRTLDAKVRPVHGLLPTGFRHVLGQERLSGK
jgi:hypothetical protein